MKPEKISAIILAAGYSSRIKDFKPLLPLGGITLLERGILLFRTTGVRDIRVIFGHRAADLLPLLKQRGIRWVVNENDPEGMFSSVIAGIRTLQPDREAFFLLPVDVPLVRPQTVLDLLEALSKTPSKILYPVYRGKRGHPPLISTDYLKEIQCWKGTGGLRAFLEQYESQSSEVEVADEYILRGLNTPEDFRQFIRRYAHYAIPSIGECRALLKNKLGVDPRVLAHSRRVARVALYLGRALNRSGGQLNLQLIVAAGLLHDLAKGQPRHAKTGENILKKLGFPMVAKIVGSHADISSRKEGIPNEEEVLYLADKMVLDDRIVPLIERYQIVQEQLASDPKAWAAATRRWADAFRIKEKIEREMGRKLEFLFTEPLPNDLSFKTR